MATYDVTIIGSGPGGYVAAIRCAQLGMKTTIIERYNTLGGTCTNVGCIPSKALLDSSEHFHNAAHQFKVHGITLENLGVDFTQMIKQKDDVVKTNTMGLNFLMKKNKIDVHIGHGSFVTKNKIAIKKNDGSTEEIETKNVIIATGSKPSALPGIAIDKKRVITSTEVLALKEIPKEMVVIGGGVIGCELASVYARLGTKVKIVEYFDSLIATMDRDLGKELQRCLKNLGMEFYLSHKVTGVTADELSVTVTAENLSASTKASEDKSVEQITLKADYCLVAVGRKPYTDGLALENAGLQTDEKGRIAVNEHLETSVGGIYAIGDVIRGAMLAHKAEEEGVLVAETIAGQKPHINYLLIPGVVYTWPEVAAVGSTEQELTKENHAFKKGSFPFKASGRARAANDSDGFIKVLADKETDEILGVHMIGPRAADMIAEAVVAMEFSASAEDIARISHAHPTFTEAFREACLIATDNRAIHL
ncbi:MAG TPA: dihydrolipoyl dehydrogenase [Chitinophagales bacterium]|nr:dihydrolipoyl dehydrogenase [Chitinophagales bacterium]